MLRRSLRMVTARRLRIESPVQEVVAIVFLMEDGEDLVGLSGCVFFIIATPSRVAQK
jgi:hypothetical protein